MFSFLENSLWADSKEITFSSHSHRSSSRENDQTLLENTQFVNGGKSVRSRKSQEFKNTLQERLGFLAGSTALPLLSNPLFLQDYAFVKHHGSQHLCWMWLCKCDCVTSPRSWFYAVSENEFWKLVHLICEKSLQTITHLSHRYQKSWVQFH